MGIIEDISRKVWYEQSSGYLRDIFGIEGVTNYRREERGERRKARGGVSLLLWVR
jgi:hypothetical protein